MECFNQKLQDFWVAIYGCAVDWRAIVGSKAFPKDVHFLDLQLRRRLKAFEMLVAELMRIVLIEGMVQ